MQFSVSFVSFFTFFIILSYAYIHFCIFFYNWTYNFLTIFDVSKLLWNFLQKTEIKESKKQRKNKWNKQNFGHENFSVKCSLNKIPINLQIRILRLLYIRAIYFDKYSKPTCLLQRYDKWARSIRVMHRRLCNFQFFYPEFIFSLTKLSHTISQVVNQIFFIFTFYFISWFF